MFLVAISQEFMQNFPLFFVFFLIKVLYRKTGLILDL